MSWRQVIDGRTVLTVPQGTSWSWSREFLSASGEPVDLTQAGYSANAQLRARNGAQTVLYEWDSDTANCQLTADGQIILTLEPEETSEWLFRRGVWDLEVTDPDGVITRIDAGVLVVSPEVTRS